MLAWAGRLLGMCMPFWWPRVWTGGKPAISMRACAGVVHAFGSRRLGYPVTTFARPVQAGSEAGPGGSGKGSLPAHPDRPHPQARPAREHPAFRVSIVAVMRLS